APEDPHSPLRVRLLGGGAGRPRPAFRRGGLRHRLRDAERRAGPRAAAEPGPELPRPAAGPHGHQPRDGRRRPGARRGRAPRQPAQPRRLGAGPPVHQRHRLPATHRGPQPAPRRARRRHPAVRRPAHRRRQRTDRGPRQQRARARAGARVPARRQAHRRRVLRRRLPRVRPRVGDPGEHPARQARDGPLQGVRLQGRHGLPGHRLRDRAAAVPAGVHPARRHRSRRPLPRQLRARGLGGRRLALRHRALEQRLPAHRPEDGRGPRGRPASLGLV
ncbi:MAG: ThiJ/PfpI domain protein, partial [uncultured Pseudonocardia sp.]